MSCPKYQSLRKKFAVGSSGTPDEGFKSSEEGSISCEEEVEIALNRDAQQPALEVKDPKVAPINEDIQMQI